MIRMSNKKTLVLGASSNPARYSYLAINQLRSKGHDVVAIGKHSGKVEGFAGKSGTRKSVARGATQKGRAPNP